MREISCEIIRDLLPSYMDGICSEPTRELVEEHLLDCEECSCIAGRMRQEEIKLGVAGDCAEEDGQELDYMKKVKRYVLNRSLFSFAILFFVVAAGLATVFYRNSAVPVYWYYTALPVLVLPAYLMLLDHTFENKVARWKAVMLLVSILNIIYMGILENWLIHTVRVQNTGLWQGPFVHGQLMAISLLHVALFIGAVCMNIRTGNSCKAILVTSVAGGCASLAFAALLKRLDNPQEFMYERNREIGIFLTEGLVLFLILWIMEKRRKKGIGCFSDTDVV